MAPLWSEFVERYEREWLADLKAATSRRDSRNTLLKFGESCNVATLEDATTAALSQFLAAESARKLSPQSVDTRRRQILAALRWAESMFDGYRAPRLPRKRRAKAQRVARGRPISLEEFERLLGKVAKVRKREPAKWKRLLEGMWLSGLRLNEALRLTWNDGPICVVESSDHFLRLRIEADADKSGEARILPLVPEFQAFLQRTPRGARHGLVFGISTSSKRAGRYITRMGRAAGIVVDKASGKCASAHELRRSFGNRWSMKVQPAVLKTLMRHSDISTTMRYYVEQDARDVDALLWEQFKRDGGQTIEAFDPEAEKRADAGRRSWGDIMDELDAWWDGVWERIQAGEVRLFQVEQTTDGPLTAPSPNQGASNATPDTNQGVRLVPYEMQADEFDDVSREVFRDKVLTGKMAYLDVATGRAYYGRGGADSFESGR